MYPREQGAREFGLIRAKRSGQALRSSTGGETGISEPKPRGIDYFGGAASGAGSIGAGAGSIGAAAGASAAGASTGASTTAFVGT